MSHDLILVGGGLQNALIALAWADARPADRVVLCERGRQCGGNHTWSFFRTDVSDATWRRLEPLLEARWPRYDIAFPHLTRTVEAEYASFTGAAVDRGLRALFDGRPDWQLRTGAAVSDVAPGAVTLDDGEVLRAPLIVDARGPTPRAGRCGYQKFLGLELQLAEDADLVHPLLFDASPPQDDGFRFVYALPLGPRRVLVEDTTYADRPTLDRAALRAHLLDWVAARGWRVGHVVRTEEGALPIPWRGALAELADGVLTAGYAGGWFHPTTGFSLPVAARLAEALAAGEPLEPLRRALRTQQRFCERLNWMLFRGTPPDQRWRLFERTYRYADARVARFYGLRMSPLDRAAFLFRRWPGGISMVRMINALVGRQ